MPTDIARTRSAVNRCHGHGPAARWADTGMSRHEDGAHETHRHRPDRQRLHGPQPCHRAARRAGHLRRRHRAIAGTTRRCGRSLRPGGCDRAGLCARDRRLASAGARSRNRPGPHHHPERPAQADGARRHRRRQGRVLREAAGSQRGGRRRNGRRRRGGRRGQRGRLQLPQEPHAAGRARHRRRRRDRRGDKLPRHPRRGLHGRRRRPLDLAARPCGRAWRSGRPGQPYPVHRPLPVRRHRRAERADRHRPPHPPATRRRQPRGRGGRSGARAAAFFQRRHRLDRGELGRNRTQDDAGVRGHGHARQHRLRSGAPERTAPVHGRAGAGARRFPHDSRGAGAHAVRTISAPPQGINSASTTSRRSKSAPCWRRWPGVPRSCRISARRRASRPRSTPSCARRASAPGSRCANPPPPRHVPAPVRRGWSVPGRSPRPAPPSGSSTPACRDPSRWPADATPSDAASGGR